MNDDDNESAPKPEPPEPRYLGDGVYATFDGYHIWLKAGGMHHDDNQIALEPAVFSALLEYQRKVWSK